MNRRTITALLAVALALPLAGCWKEQQAALQVCNAQIPYQGRWAPWSSAITPMVTCMGKAGYVRDFNNRFCMSQAVPRRSAYCYRPKGFFPALGYRIQMLGNHGPKAPVTDINKP
jgi:hypothetical protein